MRIIEHFMSFLAPHDCLVCSSEGSLLCTSCSKTQLIPIPPRCYRCFSQSNNYSTCRACRHHSVLKHLWVRCSYNNTAKQLVHELKFKFAKEAEQNIAAQLETVLPKLSLDTVIVHVPATTSHIRQRGFDQSALIARELSRNMGLPHIHAMARIGQQRQVGASAAVRKLQMKDAFRIIADYAVKDVPILLVDDVLTTGSTLEAAALVLRRAGARSVSAVVFAQA